MLVEKTVKKVEGQRVKKLKKYGHLTKKCKICNKTIKLNNKNFKTKKMCSDKCRRISQSETIRGEGNPNWKGKKAKYQARHKWLYSYHGEIDFCQHCYKEGKGYYDWANISGKYERDIGDWARLCRSCHRKFDIDYRGEKCNFSKLKEKDIIKIRSIYSKNEKTIRELSNEYNLTFQAIYNIVKRKSWKHI